MPGTFTSVATSDAQPGIRYETPHFVLRWDGDAVSRTAAEAAGAHLEFVWDYFTGTIGFPIPFCGSATKYKVNVAIREGYGLTGGADGNGNPGIWIGPAAVADRFGLAHELTHSLQALSGGLRGSPFTGWLFESHANWMTTQLPEFRSDTHCSIFLKQYPHLYYGSTRTRYCNWQFLEYIKNRYGYGAINDIWRKSPMNGDPAQATADPFGILMANQGWTLEQLNDAFGDWAMRNANWDYINPDGTDQGAIYRANYGGYAPSTGSSILAATILDPIDLANRRFAVPFAWAPQRWGYNIVKLYADAGASSVRVDFRGVVQSTPATTSLPGLNDEPPVVPAPNSGWRYGLIAVGADGKARYSAMQRGSDGHATIALRPGDTGLYMVVLAAPTAMQQIRWDQPWYSVYRYPWMAQFTGAMPENFQPGAVVVPGGRRHANGGGWVAAGATVAATAYVGPYARVLSGTVSGNARIEDHAVVADQAQVLGNARIGGLTVLRKNTVVRDDALAYLSFLGLGEYENDIVLSGTAGNIGDVEQRGASFSRGFYYGFVDQAAATDPLRGSALTAPVREVTAAPTYVWRP
ncbi:hypothetical protein ASG29_06270 [Sphingomonas sp. Leaf412]|nr:hypothetical protein ASG29_06270 [Sphingomonas sp. Leaf412]